jgi:superfamily I DNA/RNA helicase
MAPDIVKAMNDHGIPYQVVGEETFFRHEPISTVIDILRMTVMQSNTVLLQKLNEKKIDGFAETSLLEIAENTQLHSAEQYIRGIIATYLPDIMVTHKDDVDRLLALSAPHGTDISSFLSFLQLGSGADTYSKSAEQVALMTLHAAKGLEFSYVFIVGCEDGLLPYTLFAKGDSDPEEERRLLYVGMTRAKRMLFLSHAKKRNLYGRAFTLPISPFLDSIKEELVKRAKTEKRERYVKDKQLSLFS